MTPEEAKENLQKGLNHQHDSSATELARQILGKDANGNDDPNASEKEQKIAAKAKSQDKVVQFSIKSHPLVKFAQERKQKCLQAELPDEMSKERCGKADSAAVHFFKLKKASETGDPFAPDNLHKWDARVGSEIKGLDRMVEHLPLETGEKRATIPELPEEVAKDGAEDRGPSGSVFERDDMAPSTPPELDMPPDETVLLQESDACEGAKACQQKAKENERKASDLASSVEKCDKNDKMMSSKLAEYAHQHSATQTKLENTRAMVKSLAPDVGEAANMAAGAAIKASSLHIAAHKLAQESPAKVSEANIAIEKAAEAHSKQVLAELRVTEANTYAELS